MTSVKDTVSSLMEKINVVDSRQQGKVKFPLVPALRMVLRL